MTTSLTTSPTTNIGWQNIMATSWKWLQSYTTTCSWACSCACSHLYLCKWLQEQLQPQLQARLPTSDGKISCQQHGNNSCSHACIHACSHFCSHLFTWLQAWVQIAVYYSITIPISWHNITGGVPTCYTGRQGALPTGVTSWHPMMFFLTGKTSWWIFHMPHRSKSITHLYGAKHNTSTLATLVAPKLLYCQLISF